jgi:hypothetical protein
MVLKRAINGRSFSTKDGILQKVVFKRKESVMPARPEARLAISEKSKRKIMQQTARVTTPNQIKKRVAK